MLSLRGFMDFFLTDILGPIFGLVVVFLLIPFLLTILFCSIKNAWENRDRATSKTNTASQSHNATSAPHYESDVDDQIDNDSDGTLLSPGKHAKEFRDIALLAYEDRNTFRDFIEKSLLAIDTLSLDSECAFDLAFQSILLSTMHAAIITKDVQDTNYHICCNRYALLDATIFMFFTTRNIVCMNCKQSFIESFDFAFFTTASSYFKQHLGIEEDLFSKLFFDRVEQYEAVMLNEANTNANLELFYTLTSFFGKDFCNNPLASEICVIGADKTFHLRQEVLKILEATKKNTPINDAIKVAIDQFPR